MRWSPSNGRHSRSSLPPHSSLPPTSRRRARPGLHRRPTRVISASSRRGVRRAGFARYRPPLRRCAAFLADAAAAGKRAATLGRRLAAIRYFHRAAGYDTPTGEDKVKAVLSGIRRTIGAAPVRKKAATADITIAMAATGTSLRELRDRAVLLLGFAGAFRRSELVALDVADIEDVPEGLLITIRRSKTDQEGQGRKVAIPRGEIACPVAALKAWLEAAGITEGAVFRRVFNKRNQRVSAARLGACNVAAIVKVAARKLGLEAAGFAGLATCRHQTA
jgi:site-specific recombinase XerC